MLELINGVSEAKEIDSNTESMSELGDAVQGARTSSKKLLVVVPNLYSTRLLPAAPLARLERQIADQSGEKDVRPLFTISGGPLALDPAGEKELDPTCVGTEMDRTGTSDFGCAILQAGRGYYRKRVLDTVPGVKTRFVAIMQSTKPNDYLVLVHPPTP